MALGDRDKVTIPNALISGTDEYDSNKTTTSTESSSSWVDLNFWASAETSAAQTMAGNFSVKLADELIAVLPITDDKLATSSGKAYLFYDEGLATGNTTTGYKNVNGESYSVLYDSASSKKAVAAASKASIGETYTAIDAEKNRQRQRRSEPVRNRHRRYRLREHGDLQQLNHDRIEGRCGLGS